ncbi:MAG: PQQ-like beta-propeller repeat protein [Candidatus Hydrogenedentes bacterium]|nr:PQQ-like beta-propeller repeat protein [Candidatus Hydrogenedentota bacterium]
MTIWPADGLKPLWTIDGVGEGYSSASVAKGAVYTTGMTPDTHHGLLTSLTLDGKRNWQIQYGPEWEGNQPGTHCCPAVDDGRIFVLSGHGLLVCVNAANGKVIWQKDIAKTFGGEVPACGFAESLLIDGEQVICTPGGKDAALVALDKKKGEVAWTTKGFSEQSAYCSPILIERGGLRLIVTLTVQSLVGVDASNGAVVWKTPFDETEKLQNHSVSPVYADGLIYVTSGHRKGGQMYSLAEDGRGVALKWSDEVLNTLHGGLVFVDGYVYGSNTTHRWVCLRASDGNVMYRTSGVGQGSIIYADGNLYCYGEKGTLGLVRAKPEAYEEVSRFKIVAGEGQHWAHPVISDGTLYIRHGDTLSAFDIKAKQ